VFITFSVLIIGENKDLGGRERKRGGGMGGGGGGGGGTSEF